MKLTAVGVMFRALLTAALLSGAAMVVAPAAHAVGGSVSIRSEDGVIKITDAPGDALVLTVTDHTITTNMPVSISNLVLNPALDTKCYDLGRPGTGYVTDCPGATQWIVHLGDGDDRATMNIATTAHATVFGEDGNDVMTGTMRVGYFGGNGNDTITDPWPSPGDGSGGWLEGDAGNDTITGGWGTTLDGNDGNDTLIATNGATWSYGGKGADVFWADKGEPGFENGVDCGGAMNKGDRAVDVIHFRVSSLRRTNTCVMKLNNRYAEKMMLEQ